MAHRTVASGHVFHQPVAVALRTGVIERTLQISEDSKEACLPTLFRFAIEEQVLHFFRQLLERRFQINAISCRDDLDLINQILRSRARPERTVKQRLRPIINNFGGIEIIRAAEAVALRAGSVGAVE